MTKSDIPKMGFLQRVKIAFSDKAAVARVLAVTAALNGEKVYDCDPEDLNTHEWGNWKSETWEKTYASGKKMDYTRYVRKCKRCDLPHYKDSK